MNVVISSQEIMTAIMNTASYAHELPEERIADSYSQYQDRFPGYEKADMVYNYIQQCCPNLPFDKIVYVSIGGGNGGELKTIISKLGLKHAILFEYMETAVATARELLAEDAKSGVDITYLVGDAAQHIARGQRRIRELMRDDDIIGVIVSAQAVLHEMTTRSDVNRWDIDRLFSLYCELPLRIFHSREPVHPAKGDPWSGQVRLEIPGVKGETLRYAANTIREKLQHVFKGKKNPFDGQIINPGEAVQMPGPLAVELLHKFLRYQNVNSLTYEMDESLTHLRADVLCQRISLALRGNRDEFAPRYCCTPSFEELYQSRKVRAYAVSNDDSVYPISTPLCFAEMAGWVDRRAITNNEVGVTSSLPASNWRGSEIPGILHKGAADACKSMSLSNSFDWYDINSEACFGNLCREILMHEFGKLMHTLYSKDPDCELDCEHNGEYDGKIGQFVFQFKYVDPHVATDIGRSCLESVLLKLGETWSCELDKPGLLGADDYYIMTNAEVSKDFIDEWQQKATQLKAPYRLHIWDRLSLESMAKKHGLTSSQFSTAKISGSDKDKQTASTDKAEIKTNIKKAKIKGKQVNIGCHISNHNNTKNDRRAD